MGSVICGGVRFVVYSNDHPPRHAHGFLGNAEIIVDFRRDGNVALADRKDAAQREEVRHQEGVQRGIPLRRTWLHYGRRFMAKHKVVTTDAEIDRALERARTFTDPPRVIAVEYRPGAGLDLLILKLSDGHRQLIPREDLEGLQEASKGQIGHVEIIGNGTGLRWPDLNVDHYVPSLLGGIYGTRRWMAMIGQSGGSAQSVAKRKASQRNGLKGGRPKRNRIAISA
jgi:Protein of unknown function (DUF2442)